jgi:hypothetical protein
MFKQVFIIRLKVVIIIIIIIIIINLTFYSLSFSNSEMCRLVIINYLNNTDNQIDATITVYY